MCGLTDDMITGLFGFTPMPATMKQLQEGNPQCDMVYQILDNACFYKMMIEDDGKYWMSDSFMAKALEQAEKKAAFWQKRVEYIQAHRKALAEKFPAQPAVSVAA